MSILLFSFLLFFISCALVTAQEGGEPGSSVFVFGKCPEKCDDFDKVFEVCSELRQIGCKFELCDAASPTGPKFTCTIGDKSDVPPTVEVLPGDKLLFQNLEVDFPLSFFITFKPTRLDTDFYLLSDATGSMESEIGNVQAQFRDIVSFFRNANDVKNPAFGVGIYRDETELAGGFKNEQSINMDDTLSQNAINSITATGGDDADEANLVALYKVATDPSIGWRSRSRKILLYFGDFPGHEPTCSTALGTLTRSRVIAALNAKKITVIAVGFRTRFDLAPQRNFNCGSAPPAGPGQASEITSATQGVLSTAGTESPVDSIILALQKLPKVFNVDSSDCDGKLMSTYSTALPFTLSPGDSRTVEQTVSVKKEFCPGDSFTCQLKYTESGADLPTTEITFKDIIGCP